MPGTRVVFFKNGACQGLAFEDLREGKYFPAASLFTHPSQEEPAEVTFNFGPDFKFAPQGAEYGAVRPMSEVLASPSHARNGKALDAPAPGLEGTVRKGIDAVAPSPNESESHNPALQVPRARGQARLGVTPSKEMEEQRPHYLGAPKA
eukprot:scaffold820_cov376-Prasinococcus_capsulatus_cf.AAC.19